MRHASDAPKQVHIEIKRTSLYDRIEHGAYLTSEGMDEDGHARHLVRDLMQEGNKERVDDLLGIAFGECLEMLFPYVKRPADDVTEIPDDRELGEVFDFLLLVPRTVSSTTLTLVRELMREYMVCTVLASWIGTVAPDAAEVWAARAEEARVEISIALEGRMKVRRRLHPF
jgi:hypothetical protein